MLAFYNLKFTIQGETLENSGFVFTMLPVIFDHSNFEHLSEADGCGMFRYTQPEELGITPGDWKSIQNIWVFMALWNLICKILVVPADFSVLTNAISTKYANVILSAIARWERYNGKGATNVKSMA